MGLFPILGQGDVENDIDINIDIDTLLISPLGADDTEHKQNVEKYLKAILRTNKKILNNQSNKNPDFETAFFEGRAFSAGTKTKDIQKLKSLRYRLENPAGSNKLIIIDLRRLVNSRKSNDPVLPYAFFLNTAPIEDGIEVTPNNLITGGEPSVANFVWENANNDFDIDAALDNSLTLNGIPLEIRTPRILPPDTSISYEIYGVTDYMKTRASMAVVWHEVDLEIES